MARIPVLDHDALLAAISPTAAIDAVRRAFIRHQRGDWVMPPKVYLPSPPHGDFRAMPALGDGLAILKWITSFPGGHPTVTGLVCVSDATDGTLLMLLDGRAVTALRTGAVAAVASEALASSDRSVGIIGCGVHGAWAARCLAAAGFGPGVCADPNVDAADALAAELSWRSGSRSDAAAAGVVTTTTPGQSPVITVADLHAGLHLNMLGADGPGKAEATIDVVAQASVFCDDWAQAAHGGEISGAVGAGRIGREDVTDLGDVLTGAAPGRTSESQVTLFDSTGLAIQDLAIAHAARAAWQAGTVTAETVNL